MSYKARLLAACVSVVCCTACHSVQRPVSAAPQPAKPPLTHTVKTPGETLGYIAQWYTGSWENWPKLAENNPRIKVNRIKLGQNVVIPSDLVATKQPLTKENFRKLRKEMGQSRASLKRPTAKIDKPVEVAVAKTESKSIAVKAAPRHKQVAIAETKAAPAPEVVKPIEPAIVAEKQVIAAPVEVPKEIQQAVAEAEKSAVVEAGKSAVVEEQNIPSDAIPGDEIVPPAAAAQVEPAAVSAVSASTSSNTLNDVALDKEIEDIARELKQKEASPQQAPATGIEVPPPSNPAPDAATTAPGEKQKLGNKAPEHAGGSMFTCQSDNCSLTIVD